MKLTRILALALALGLAWGAAPAGAAVDQPEDTLVYAWSNNIGPLNPHGFGVNQMFGQALVYEPLVQYGPGGEIKPWLAESWTISEDGRVYTFKLRPDVVFSDGSPFTAQVAVKNFEHIMGAKPDWLEVAVLTESYEALDDHTFRLTLKEPYAAALQELTLVRPLRFLGLAGFPDEGLTLGGIKKPIGTGPWMLVETRLGEYDLLERNEKYWGEKPKFKRLMIKAIPDATSRAVALETGEIDLVATAIMDHGSSGVNPDAFRQLSAGSVYDSRFSIPRNTRLLALNSAREPTNELAVRKAITAAVNRPALIRGVLLEQELPAEELLDPSTPYCDISLTPYKYDPAEAGRLLDAAGWRLEPGRTVRVKDGRELIVELQFLSNEQIMRSIAEVVKQDLAQVGIQADLIGLDSGAFGQAQHDGDFGLIFCESNGAPYDPFTYLSAMRTSGHADYQAQRGLPGKDKINADISRAMRATDPAELQALIGGVLTALHEEAVYLPISRTVDKALYKKDNLTGFEFNPVSYDLPFIKLERVK